MKVLIILLAGFVFFAIAGNDTGAAPWREVDTSPRIEALKKQIESGGPNAASKFWGEMKDRGTPLIEKIPNDPNHVLLTFLYRAESPTRSVVLLAQLYVRDNRDDSLRVLTRLLDTDVWYKTYWIRSDMRFTYSLVPNPNAQSLGNHPELQAGRGEERAAGNWRGGHDGARGAWARAAEGAHRGLPRPRI